MSVSNLFQDLGLDPPEEINARLEMAFMEEYLNQKGYHYHDLHHLPPELAQQLATEASIYASNRLAEVETRAHLVQGMHGTLP